MHFSVLCTDYVLETMEEFGPENTERREIGDDELERLKAEYEEVVKVKDGKECFGDVVLENGKYVRKEPADCELKHIFDLPIRNPIESENTRVFITVYGGPLHAQAEELDELRFWTWSEIRDAMGKDLFTPNLERELKLLERQLGIRN